MERIRGFLSELPFPACVIDKSGKLVAFNASMGQLQGDGNGLSRMGVCDFTPSRETCDCGNCGHYPVSNGKCVIPRVTISSRLVMAAGIEKMGGATIAFYQGGSALDPLKAHAAMEEILFLVGETKGKRRPTELSGATDWKVTVFLRDLVALGLARNESNGAGYDLKVRGTVTMDFASLSALSRLIRRVGAELLLLSPNKPLKARMLKKPKKTGVIQVISMMMEVEGMASKSISGTIPSIDLRLSRYCQRLGSMMGLAIPAPVTLFKDKEVEVYLPFELDGGFASSEGGWIQSGGDSVFYGLSRRERQVVAMVVEGNSNDQISKEMGITISTVKQHIKNIYRRTGVKSRAELIFRADNEIVGR